MRVWSVFLAMALLSVTVSTRAGAQSMEAVSVSVTPPPQAGSGCPYRNGSHCCCGGRMIRLGATTLALGGLGAAVALQVMAVQAAHEFGVLSEQRDPNHTMMAASDPQLRALAGQRDAYQAAAIGMFIGGGILTAAATLMWLAPRHGHCPYRNRMPPVAMSLSPNSAAVTVTF